MKTVLITILGALMAATTVSAEKAATEGAEVGKWTMDLDAAKKVAAEKELPLLLNFSGSDWCGWCKLMDEKVFSQEAWSAYATNNVMMVLLDFPQDSSLVPEKYVSRNQELSEKFAVQGYPTFIVLDSDGETELGRLSAGQEKTPESFKAEIVGLLKNSAKAQKAYMDALSDEDKATYKAIEKKIADNKASMQKQQELMAECQMKMQTLGEEAEALQEELVEFRVSQLGEEEQAAYKKLKEEFEAESQKLMDWIQTQPEQNEENMKYFETQRGKIEEMMIKLQQY